MELNGIKLFDAPHPKLLTPDVKREIINCIDIFHTKKLSLHHYADLVGNLSGYDFIMLDKDFNVGGYCNYREKIIALKDEQGEPIASIFHEIGHSIQAKLGMFENDWEKPLSYQVKIEHQAETIAYNLYSALVNKNIDHKKFKVYFNIEDIKWLNDYYDGFFENDLF